jgi:hypothetical protein
MTNCNVLNLSDSEPKKFSIEQFRERLRPQDALDILEEVQNTVRDQWEVLSKNQIDALKLQSDIQFRKLAKIIPDIKAMDHNIGETASKVNFILNLNTDGGEKLVKSL